MVEPTRTVVVGAGSSGAVVAARLSEDPDNDVVLVEAGPFYARDEDIPEALVNGSDPSFSGHDWGQEAWFVEPPALRAPAPYWRGRLVGGSSAVNASIAHRGDAQDFDDWAAAGNGEWSWAEVLPFFRRLERDLDFGAHGTHGDAGPVPIARFPRESWPPILRDFELACLARGFPRCVDVNAPGWTGVAPTPRNLDGARRASSLVTYVRAAQSRPNLTIRAETLVRRVCLDGPRATGVEIDDGGRVERLDADRVVLSAGALRTPQILILSGIGPRDEMARLSIAPVVVSEGVGRHLRDHPFVPMMALAHTAAPPNFDGVQVTLAWPADGSDRVDLMLIPQLMPDPSLVGMDLDPREGVIVMLASLLARPHSEGWLTLRSTDPADEPDVHLNLLSDPHDVCRVMEATRLAYDLATSPPMSDHISQVLVPDTTTIADDAALAAWSRQVAYGIHVAGTCRMGPPADTSAVVDGHLAVRGTKNLYVADASVMPQLPTGFTNLACFMIGERLAAWLRADDGSRS
jgi:choline dehydrogenase